METMDVVEANRVGGDMLEIAGAPLHLVSLRSSILVACCWLQANALKHFKTG